MPKFAKLIELENDEQVLLTVQEDNDLEGGYTLSIKSEFEACIVEMVLGFTTKEAALTHLNAYTTVDAVKMRKRMFDIIES